MWSHGFEGRASQDARWRWLGALLAATLVAGGVRNARALDDGPTSRAPCDEDDPCESISPTPLGLSVSLERLFGQNRVDRRIETSERTVEQSYDTFNLFADQTPHEGYSSPRLAADYLFSLPLSVGGAVGYHAVRRGDDSSGAWVLAPRLGYFWPVSRRIALWPRVGMTWLWLDGDDAEDERALTLEALVMFLVAEGRLGLSLAPHLELGLPGGDVQLDERGVQLGATVFF